MKKPLSFLLKIVQIHLLIETLASIDLFFINHTILITCECVKGDVCFTFGKSGGKYI